MADITMCSGVGCESRSHCYRFTAPKSELQMSFIKPPLVNGVCEHYWNVGRQGVVTNQGGNNRAQPVSNPSKRKK